MESNTTSSFCFMYMPRFRPAYLLRIYFSMWGMFTLSLIKSNIFTVIRDLFGYISWPEKSAIVNIPESGAVGVILSEMLTIEFINIYGYVSVYQQHLICLVFLKMKLLGETIIVPYILWYSRHPSVYYMLRWVHWNSYLYVYVPIKKDHLKL